MSEVIPEALQEIRARGTFVDVAAVPRVIVILSSSRGGSSLLHSLIGTHPGSLWLAGEHTIVYRLAGLLPTTSEGDQYAVSDDARRRMVELLGEFVVANRCSRERADWLKHAALRLRVQWPAADFAMSDVLECESDSYLGLLREMKFRGAAVDAAPYDRPDRWENGSRAPDWQSISMQGHLLEEPPFVVLPRDVGSPEPTDIRNGTLILKASVDAYNTGLIRSLFPNSWVGAIHLTRNPAASVNGLYDGWRSKAFHSFAWPVKLAIPGYTGATPGSSKWWKFDVPPDAWAWTRRDLWEICAHQWAAAHESIVTTVRSAGFDAQIHSSFDDLIQPSACNEAIRKIFEFCGLSPAGIATRDLPIVMATGRPAPRRWRKRAADVIEALDAVPEVWSIAEALGYYRRAVLA